MSEARRELKGTKKDSRLGDQKGKWSERKPRMGAHMSIAGGHYRAAEAAAAAGCEALQVFTKSSNQWAAKALTDEEVVAFRRALEVAKVEAVVGHNSYLINLGSPEAGLWEKSIEAMVVEVERAERLGLSDLVFHPGSHMGAGEEAGHRASGCGGEGGGAADRWFTGAIGDRVDGGAGQYAGLLFRAPGGDFGAVWTRRTGWGFAWTPATCSRPGMTSGRRPLMIG